FERRSVCGWISVCMTRGSWGARTKEGVMDRKQVLRDFLTHARSLFPLFRYLVLQTETHAFCLALACAALIGFYPFCVLLLSFMRHALHWNGGYSTLQNALQIFYPTGGDFLISNLEVTVGVFRKRLDLGSVFWVFLG